MRRAGVLIAVLALAGCGGGSATQTTHGGRTQVVAGPLQVSNGPAQAADPGDRPLALALTGTSDRVHVTFKHAPRSGLLFDLDTGAGPVAPPARSRAADREPDQDDDRAARGRARAARRQGPRDQGGAGLQGLGRGRPAQGQAHQARDDAQRAAAALGQRRCHRAGPAHERHRRRLRAAHERARRRPRPRVHALQLARRLRGRRQPLLRHRPRRDGARGPRPPAPGAHRRAAGARSCPSRSRAGASTSSTTTRCCAPATRGRSGSRPATPTPRGAASWPPRAATVAAWASCSCTRPIPASRPRSCSTAASPRSRRNYT